MQFIVDEYRNILAIIAIELVLALPCMEKRKGFWLRFACGLVVALAFDLLYVLVYAAISVDTGNLLSVALSIVWYAAVLAVTGALMAFCFKMNKTELVWVLITGYAVQHFVYVVVVELIFFGLIGSAGNIWAQLAAYVAGAAVAYSVVYFLFTPNLKKRRHLYVQDSWRNFAVLSAFLIIFLASTFINQANARQDYVGVNYLSIFSDCVNCVLVVAVQYVSLRSARMRSEKELAVAMFDGERKQYEAFKNAVDYINVKVHDLKHAITAMQREGGISPRRIEEAAENIAVYQSFVKTGNETLDFLLTDKNLACIKYGITLSCIADASALAGMEEEDIYVLFGNMLDNAVEYLKTVEDAEKRSVRLYIKSSGNLAIIHQENYFDGEIAFADGLPRSVKGDDRNHGFGMKSMRAIAHKYGGEMRVSAADGLFKLDIVMTK